MTATDSGYIAALDVGERRIGVAIASTIARLPSPYTTIDRLKTKDVYGWIKDFVKKEEIITIVIGLPRDMTGRETAQTVNVRKFSEKLSEVLETPQVYQDEAVTSVMAEERLKSRNKSYDKADIDAEAAAIILQDYLTESQQNIA